MKKNYIFLFCYQHQKADSEYKKRGKDALFSTTAKSTIRGSEIIVWKEDLSNH